MISISSNIFFDESKDQIHFRYFQFFEFNEMELTYEIEPWSLLYWSVRNKRQKYLQMQVVSGKAYAKKISGET